MARLIHAEDENTKARALQRVLRMVRSDLTYERYETAQEAVEAMNEADDVAVVVSDWQLPGGGGSVLEAAARQAMPAIVVSGSEPPVGFHETYPGIQWVRFTLDEVQAELVPFVGAV